jgi:aryl-alcohol dehydrogenase-like predicted oxidoreductase
VLQNPNVTSAITGASRPEQLTDNLKAVDVVLEPAVMAKIDELLDGVSRFDPTFIGVPLTALV